MKTQYSDPMGSTFESQRLIRRVSANELYYYAEVKLPRPVENRDFVAHLICYEDHH